MDLDLKDAFAIAALCISLYNLVRARSDSRNQRRLSFSQKRQELISLVVNKLSLISVAEKNAELLAIQCDIYFGLKSDLAIAIRGNTSIITSRYAFGDTEILLAEYSDSARDSSDDLIKIENRIGTAKRQFEAAQRDSAQIDDAVVHWRASFDRARNALESGDKSSR